MGHKFIIYNIITNNSHRPFLIETLVRISQQMLPQQTPCQYLSVSQQTLDSLPSTVSKQIPKSVSDIDSMSHNNNSSASSQSDLNKSQWTLEQQTKLYKLHDELGNKWSMIAQMFQNRNDNCVKNHFFSRLRKGLRKLNKIIVQEYKKTIKEIKNIVLYKIIEVTQDKPKFNSVLQIPENKETYDFCIKLKNRLLQYSYDEKQQNDAQKHIDTGKLLIHDLINFSKQYKRKSKKQKKGETEMTDKIKLTRSLKSMSPMSDCTESFGSLFMISECSMFGSEANEGNNVQTQKRESYPLRRRVKSREEAEKPKVAIVRFHSNNQVDRQKQLQNPQSAIQSFLSNQPVVSQQSDPFLSSPLIRYPQNSHFGPQKMIEQKNEMEQQLGLHIYQDQQNQIQMRVFQPYESDHFADPELNQRNFSHFK